MKSHKLSFILLSLITVLILTFCTEDSTNPPEEELNDITNPPGGYINEIGINSQGDFFAATHEGLFISTDRGSTWHSQTLLIDSITSVTEIKITSDDYVFISYIKSGNSHILRSSDNGNTWISLSSTMTLIHQFEEDLYGNIYVAGDGLHKSSDKGNTWEVLYTDNHIFDVFFPDTSSIIIGISFDFPGQILYSSDRGITWDSTGYQIHVASFYSHNSMLFAGGVSSSIYGGGGIHKSVDGGKSWSLSGLGTASTTQYITNRINKLFIGTGYGIFSTSDDGESWTHTVDTVAISYMKDRLGYLYAGTIWGNFIRSTDDGNSWHN
ncbi:MAG: hypothetical protein IPM14_12980 [bacterium]|nr:hypothetical protein [bacterium]